MEEKVSGSKDGVGKPDTKKITVERDKDLVAVRDRGRKMAASIGFSKTDQTLIATALSEIGRNILEHAGSGEILLKVENNKNAKGIVIRATDTGPGIEDVNKAMSEGYSTGNGMGIGLSGAKRIMDEFEVESEVEVQTTIKMCKWV